MKRITAAAALAALGVAGLFAWLWWQQRQPALPPGFAMGNGRIEGEEIDIATKYSGRLAKLLVDEGDMVKAGQILAVLDTREFEIAHRQAEAQARQAQHALISSQAAVERQKALVQLARIELDRARFLFGKGHITKQTLDQNVSETDSALAMLAGVTAEVGEAEQAVRAAEEAAERIKVQIDDSTLTAPRTGRIQYRLVSPGAVLGPGGKVATLLDVNDVYMTIFLPTMQAGRVAVGAQGRIVLDALPDIVLPAAVSFVSPTAQFTPKMVETRSERERLMFRIKVRIDPALLAAHAEKVRTGLPGVAYVQLDGTAAWPERLKSPVTP